MKGQSGDRVGVVKSERLIIHACSLSITAHCTLRALRYFEMPLYFIQPVAVLAHATTHVALVLVDRI